MRGIGTITRRTGRLNVRPAAERRSAPRRERGRLDSRIVREMEDGIFARRFSLLGFSCEEENADSS